MWVLCVGFWITIYSLISLLRPCRPMDLLVTLSHELAQRYHGQLVAYYTFIEGGMVSLSFYIEEQLDSSARLFLFAMGSQRLAGDLSVAANCQNFYKMSIGNASLNEKHGSLQIGSFTGHFPTFLVFADKHTCQHDEPSIYGDSHVRVMLSNPNGQMLSGSLMGLSEHYLGLLSVYTLAMIYALYCLRITVCNSRGQHCFPDIRSVSCGCCTKWVWGISDASRTRTPSRWCCHANGSTTTSYQSCDFSKRIDSQEKRLYMLYLLLCLQFTSLLSAWLELFTQNKYAEVSYPVFGSNGMWSHMAELIATTSYYVLLGLLATITSEKVLMCTRAFPLPQCRSMESHPCRTHTFSRPNPLTGCPISVPALSAFRFRFPLSISRTIWCLLCAHVCWHLLCVTVLTEPVYAEPDRWPMEEQHGFWGGIGLANCPYYPARLLSSDFASNRFQLSAAIMSMYAIMMTMVGSVSFLSLLVVLFRTGLGLVLCARLLRSSQPKRDDPMSELYTRCGLLGFVWFMAHPSLAIVGTLFVDYVRYKVILVGVTLTQAVVSGCLLYLFTRPAIMWDISALSTTLPRLNCIPVMHSKH